MLKTVNIPQKEYKSLIEAQLRYEQIRQAIADDLFSPPPTRSRKEILEAFAATGKYNAKFMKSFAAGLKRSRYFTA